ncbi:MAG: hypothetical protein IJ852_05560 [Alphaproteobacteria bacterium]|nr:hypothetical protein [Alphaproteobacteria bacterium]
MTVTALTQTERADYNRIKRELSALKDKKQKASSQKQKEEIQRQIDALLDRKNMYDSPKRLEAHRRAEAQRNVNPKVKKIVSTALETGNLSNVLTDIQKTQPYQYQFSNPVPERNYVPLHQLSPSAAQSANQTPAQTAAKKSGNSSTHAGSRNNGTRASTASRRRTATTRSQSSTRTRTLRQTTPLDNADLDRVVRMTPTYLRNFLVQAKIITEDESNNNRSSNKLRELLRDKLSSLTDEQKKLLDAYVTEQNTAIKEHWNDIRTSGGNADSEFDMTKTIMQRDKDAAQKQAETQAEVQPQKARKSIGERLWDSLSEESKEKIKEALQTPTQSKQPAYPHLPQNLISAVKNETEEMYKYFRRHSKSCGDFKKADVLGKDGKPDAAKMLGWLNEHYPDFKESRKQKIDKTCLKYDQSQNNQPQSKANSHQQETTPPAKSDQKKLNINAMIQEAGRLR